MRKVCAVGAMVVVALLIPQASAANLLVNGDFSSGETGWTQWSAPWGGGYVWNASSGAGVLQTTNGSFGWYQAITTVPGQQYTITATFQGEGALNWVECLFFNDDGRAIYDQLDAPHDSSIIGKVDGWGMNGGMPFGPDPITSDYYPNGLKTNVITATGTTMYVGLKTGASGVNATTTATFDDVSVTPEPATITLLGLSALALLRRSRA